MFSTQKCLRKKQLNLLSAIFLYISECASNKTIRMWQWKSTQTARRRVFSFILKELKSAKVGNGSMRLSTATESTEFCWHRLCNWNKLYPCVNHILTTKSILFFPQLLFSSQFKWIGKLKCNFAFSASKKKKIKLM